LAPEVVTVKSTVIGLRNTVPSGPNE